MIRLRQPQSAWGLFFLRDWQDAVPGLTGLIGSWFFRFMELIAYWYTAQAFGATFSQNTAGMDYFTFIVLGRTVSMIPLAMLGAVVNTTKTYIYDGTMDAFLSLPRPIQVTLLQASLATLPKLVLDLTVMLLLAVSFFEFQVSLQIIPWFLALTLIAIPLFLGLSMLGSAMLIRFGRGSGITGYLESGLAVFSGVYFPLTVLPEPVRLFLQHASPLTAVIDCVRFAAMGLLTPMQGLSYGTVILAWGLLIFPLGYYSLGRAFRAARLSGRPLLVIR